MNKKFNNNIQQMWIDKYNPKNIDDIILDDIILNRINNIIKNNKMSNMIIMGMSGIGKTCVVNFLSRKLLGKYYKEGVLRLSMNEKGLDNINEILNNFSKKLFKDEFGNNINKIVIIEEADNFTDKSQIIINNIMENYSVVKFIFICNNINNIIENIQSKSIIFNFNYLDTLNPKILNRLKYILDSENITYTEESLNTLIIMSKGDIRSCINYLECIAYGYGEINIDTIRKIYNQPETTLINDIINLCLKKDFKNCIEKIDILLNTGYNTNDIIMFMLEHIKSTNNIVENIKIKYLDILNISYINVNENVNTKLQLYNSIIKLIEIN
jgi:DNA polymerase III delta prime subunit